MYGATMFSAASRRVSPGHVQERLAQALAARPDVALRLVAACAPWEETGDITDWSPVGFRRRYRELPLWFPAEAVVVAAAAVAPGVAPASDEAGDADGAESLLAQVLWLARPAGG